jgi:hypothetical protein
VSIVRVGLSETKKFAEGYEAIFGGKKAGGTREIKSSARATKARKKKKAGRKK